MAERLVRRFGIAEAAPVVGDDVKAGIRQFPHLLGPHATVGDARVEEHHRHAEPFGLPYKRRAIQADFKTVGHCVTSSRLATMNSRGKRSSTLPSNAGG